MRDLVSIIIPMYNASKFIEETIKSVLAQTYKNWELIIVNDGSTDNSVELIQPYITTDSRLSLITKTNTGVSDTRNTGIKAAKGNYIAFLDADDVWLDSNLEKKIAFLTTNTDFDFVFSNMLQADKDLKNQVLAPIGKDSNILEDLLLWNGEVIPGPCSNLVVKISCFKSGISFHKQLTTIADQNFTVQLANKFKGKLLNEALWIYRVLPNSMSKSLKVMEQDSLLTYKLYKQNNYFKSKAFERKCFANMYLILSASWLKDGRNFFKGLHFLVLAFLKQPIYTLKKVFKKLLRANE